MKAKSYAYLIAFASLILSTCHPLFCAWNAGYKQVDNPNDVPLINWRLFINSLLGEDLYKYTQKQIDIKQQRLL